MLLSMFYWIHVFVKNFDVVLLDICTFYLFYVHRHSHKILTINL